jgi:uncharacterized protein (TIGR00725 family)
VQPYVAVVGSGSCRRQDRCASLSHEVGTCLAARGAVVVCGGLSGVMEHVCRGARAQGGTTVGVLPGTDRLSANPYVDIAIATGLGEARNAVLVSACDAVIAVGGEFGTLSEIALGLKQNKPVVGLETWGLWRSGALSSAIVVSSSAAHAVECVLSRLGDMADT